MRGLCLIRDNWGFVQAVRALSNIFICHHPNSSPPLGTLCGRPRASRRQRWPIVAWAPPFPKPCGRPQAPGPTGAAAMTHCCSGAPEAPVLTWGYPNRQLPLKICAYMIHPYVIYLYVYIYEVVSIIPVCTSHSLSLYIYMYIYSCIYIYTCKDRLKSLSFVRLVWTVVILAVLLLSVWALIVLVVLLSCIHDCYEWRKVYRQ